MFDNSIKSFLFFLSLCIIAPVYSMENFFGGYCITKKQKANKDFWKAIKSAFSILYRKSIAQTMNDVPNDIEIQKVFDDDIEVKNAFNVLDETLQRGADINCKRKQERTAIMRISPYDYYEYPLLKAFFHYLVDKGADLTVYEEEPQGADLTVYEEEPLGYNLLHKFAGYDKTDDKIVETLLKGGLNINSLSTKDSLGSLGKFSPLFVAIFNNKVNNIKLLIKYGADINCKSSGGLTPLGFAIRSGVMSQIGELCRLGASLHKVNGDLSALHYIVCCRRQKKEIEAILTNARLFDPKNVSDEELDKQLKETDMETLLTLKTFNVSKDLQHLVLEELMLLNDIQGFNKELARYLFSKGCTNGLIKHAKKRAAKFKEIAETLDNRGCTALKHLYSSPGKAYIKDIEPLLNGKKYEGDIRDFINDDLVVTMPDGRRVEKFNFVKKLLEQ